MAMTPKQAEKTCLQIMIDRCASAQVDDLIASGYVDDAAEAAMVYAELRRMELRFKDEMLPLPAALRHDELAEREFDALSRNVTDPGATKGRLRRVPRGVAGPPPPPANAWFRLEDRVPLEGQVVLLARYSGADADYQLCRYFRPDLYGTAGSHWGLLWRWAMILAPPPAGP